MTPKPAPLVPGSLHQKNDDPDHCKMVRVCYLSDQKTNLCQTETAGYSLLT